MADMQSPSGKGGGDSKKKSGGGFGDFLNKLLGSVSFEFDTGQGAAAPRRPTGPGVDGATRMEPVLAERKEAFDEVEYRRTEGERGQAPAERVNRDRRVIARSIDSRREGAAKAAPIPESGGEPLSKDVRGRMEPRLGADLSAVRVHQGGDSATAAQGMSARAFTVGSDVHFNAGQYAPGTKEGDKLLAHELTHVVQGQKSGVQRKTEDAAEHGDAAGEHAGQEVSHPDEPAEKEADAVSEHVADDLHADKKGGAAPSGAKSAGGKDGDKKQGDAPSTATAKGDGKAGGSKGAAAEGKPAGAADGGAHEAHAGAVGDEKIASQAAPAIAAKRQSGISSPVGRKIMLARAKRPAAGSTATPAATAAPTAQAEDPEKVAQEATTMLKEMGDKVDSPATVKQKLAAAKQKLAPRGLQSIEAQKAPGGTGAVQFEVTITPQAAPAGAAPAASQTPAPQPAAGPAPAKQPIKRVMHRASYFNKYDVDFDGLVKDQPTMHTALIPELNGEPLFTKVVSEGGVHAEKVFITKLTAPEVWPKLVRDKKFVKGKDHAMKVVLTRSPCGTPGHDCGQELQTLMSGWAAEKRKEGYPISLQIQTISVYNGKNGAEAEAAYNSIKNLLNSEVDFGTITIEDLEAKYLAPEGITEKQKDVLKRKLAEAKKVIEQIRTANV